MIYHIKWVNKNNTNIFHTASQAEQGLKVHKSPLQESQPPIHFSPYYRKACKWLLILKMHICN